MRVCHEGYGSSNDADSGNDGHHDPRRLARTVTGRAHGTGMCHNRRKDMLLVFDMNHKEILPLATFAYAVGYDDFYAGAERTSEGVKYTTSGGCVYTLNIHQSQLIYDGSRTSLAHGCAFGKILHGAAGEWGFWYDDPYADREVALTLVKMETTWDTETYPEARDPWCSDDTLHHLQDIRGREDRELTMALDLETDLEKTDIVKDVRIWMCGN